jgi:hypothetical protein
MVLLEPAIIIAFAGNLILNLVNYSECHPYCDTWSRSTCTDAITTKWNKNFVGETLKQWISSIRKIRSISEKEKESIFLSKTVLEFATKNKTDGNITGGGAYYISNSDCSKQRNIGPKWRKASIFSNKQFDDGFLYSNEDDNGVFTGLYSYITTIHTISKVMIFLVKNTLY